MSEPLVRVIRTRIARPTLASHAAMVRSVMIERMWKGDKHVKRRVITSMVASNESRAIKRCFRDNLNVSMVRIGSGAIKSDMESIASGGVWPQSSAYKTDAFISF